MVLSERPPAAHGCDPATAPSVGDAERPAPPGLAAGAHPVMSSSITARLAGAPRRTRGQTADPRTLDVVGSAAGGSL
ncbi:MAG: hypothetical protein E6J38_06260 [Chloroflexi bacterium]|nr:MAG: hypothetical protein E6J38_06260 [Chloroflexota bacterium]